VALLELQDLSLHYHTGRGVISAVNQLSLALDAGESLGLVGESGSGKSSIAHAILRLLPAYAQIRQGRIYFAGRNLLDLTEPRLQVGDHLWSHLRIACIDAGKIAWHGLEYKIRKRNEHKQQYQYL
jgi:ABC-type glutathione transport system ATPase component